MAIVKGSTQRKIKVITGCALMTLTMTVFSADHPDMADMEKNRISAPEGVGIQIVELPEVTRPDSALMIKVETEGLNMSHDHWHLYVDGELQAMVGGGRTSYEFTPSALNPGEHVISVTVSNSSHEEYDIEDKRTIRIDPDM